MMRTAEQAREDAGAAGPATALRRLGGVLVAPVRTFRELGRAANWSDWGVPLLVSLMLLTVLTLASAPYLDVETPVREKLEAQGAPESQIQKFVALQSKILKKAAVPISLGAYLGVLMVLALVYWGGTNAFGGRITFSLTLAVLSYAWLVKILEGGLRFLSMWGGDPVRVDQVDLVLATSPAALLGAGSAGTLFFQFARTLNVFTLWSQALLALGLAEVGGLSRGAAFGLVILLFTFYVAGSVGLAALT
ncbi:MAG: YIP1 family protein [Acidobacteriota bacterium]